MHSDRGLTSGQAIRVRGGPSRSSHPFRVRAHRAFRPRVGRSSHGSRAAGSSSSRTPSMKRSTARDDSSRKRSRIASVPSLSAIALLERDDRVLERLELRVQHRARVDAVALGEHELEQEQRAPLADVLDRLLRATPRRPRARRRWRGRSCGSARARPARCRTARSGPAPRGSRASGRRAAGSATRSSRARRSGESCRANAQPCAGRSQSSARTAHSPGASSRSLIRFTVRAHGRDRFSDFRCDSCTLARCPRRA